MIDTIEVPQQTRAGAADLLPLFVSFETVILPFFPLSGLGRMKLHRPSVQMPLQSPAFRHGSSERLL
jgi:hypothetical protein